MASNRLKSEKNNGTNLRQRNPYEVLGVSRNSTDQEIKSAYRKMALKYHPDKNANDPKAADMFREVTFSYNILSDPNKRRRYDTNGFETVESETQELEFDLSSLGTMKTMLVALAIKLGARIKTTVSSVVLEDALNGMVHICPLSLGEPVYSKVEKQCAHFYSITITEKEAKSGLVCRVQSADKSKFKLLYFDQEENDGLSLALQEDSAKTGKVTSAGMYFLGFPVYHFDQSVKDPDPNVTFLKNLHAFQPLEITELKAGTHVFAVYGDNFFKSVSYTIEALCVAHYKEEKENLRRVEAQILSKRVEISKFETEYYAVLAQFNEMSSRLAQEMQTIDELFKKRSEVQASYTSVSPMKCSSSGSKNKGIIRDEPKKKWYDIYLKKDKGKKI